jgi:uncharacterized LabA/DUF88 family protein
MKTTEEIRMAVLIDADNVPFANIKAMLEELAKYGTPTFKRIYGDWTKPNLAGWKKVLLEYAITPIQQYGYTTGKNCTDSAMIIDAMDILYSAKVDAFAIVSSDSDFTRLSIRLREAGMMVIGLGERKTPNPFIVSCDKFIYLEILSPTAVEDESKAKVENEKNEKKPATPANALQKINAETIALIANSIADVADDSGWAFLGEVGDRLIKKQTDFDPRNYGFRKLMLMVKSIDAFEVAVRGQKGTEIVSVREKDGVSVAS